MPQPAEVERLSADLEAAYRRAWERIQVRQEQIASDPARWRERRRLAALLAEVEDQMGRLDVLSAKWFVHRFPAAYGQGAAAAAATLAAEFTWERADRFAVRAAAEASFADLLQATRHVRRTTKQLLRVLAKEATLGKLIEGRTATDAARDFRRQVERRGIHAVRYADGSRHGLAEYAEVVLRTTTANAYNAGTLNQCRKLGTGYVEVFDGADCGWTSHGDSDLANGTIRTVEEAAAHSIAHPRCRRSFGPRPDVADEKGRRRAAPTTTAGQRADQASSERASAGRR